MRPLPVVLVVLAAACASRYYAGAEIPKGDPNWQAVGNAYIDASRESERADAGYYLNVHCPATAQPEWEGASAVDKHRMQVDCRHLADYVDAGAMTLDGRAAR